MLIEHTRQQHGYQHGMYSVCQGPLQCDWHPLTPSYALWRQTLFTYLLYHLTSFHLPRVNHSIWRTFDVNVNSTRVTFIWFGFTWNRDLIEVHHTHVRDRITIVNKLSKSTTWQKHFYGVPMAWLCLRSKRRVPDACNMYEKIMLDQSILEMIWNSECLNSRRPKASQTRKNYTRVQDNCSAVPQVWYDRLRSDHKE